MQSQIYMLIGLAALMFLVIGGLSLLAHIYTLNGIKSRTVGDGQHGTARWATKREIQKTYTYVPFAPKLWRKGKSLPEAQGLIMGSMGSKGAMTALVDESDVHALMVAASGAGKTAFFLYPNLEYACACGMSFMATDTKGDLFRNYGHIAKDCYGYNVAVIDLRNPTRSDGFNMLHLVNKYMDAYNADHNNLAAKAKAEKYAKIISKTIVNSSGDSAAYGQNAFFYDAAEGLLAAVILMAAEYLPAKTRGYGEIIERRHIISVFKLVQDLLAPSKVKNKSQFQLLMEMLPPEHKARWFAGAALNSAEQAMASVLSTVLSRLNAFLDSEMEQILCFDTAIDAEKFVSEKSALFIVLPEEDTTKYFMVSLMIQQLYREILSVADEQGGKLKNRVVFFLDEIGTIPPIESLELMFSASRSRSLLLVPIVQSISGQLVKNYGKEGSEIIVDKGTFDNFISFIQEVTEAARASKNSLVVASIPESDIEIGGDAGKIALETIEHTFGRMESIWKPVAANEGFEVVRRRLFLDCKNPDGRDAVCSKFSQMYNENQSDFPLESREVEYMERMVSCYPIHPEVFDRLYEDWATLERFQRTRGVLRLMAAVIHELWMGNDAGLMIMPGSIPLDVPNVRDELTRHLSEGWNALVDREVDGRNSIPFQKDQSNPRYGGKLAARRVARTVMLGSAPTVRDQNVRGIEASRIRLGAIQPGENIANFNDALNTLTSSLAYLYTNPSGDRFWYDTRPTLRKTVEDRATQVSVSDVEYEIETRLKGLQRENKKPFSGVHICPASSLDVTDEQNVRLVILRPTDEYKAQNQNNKAMTAVTDILNNRGNTPRIYRNMLAFIAPDQDLMLSLVQAVRLYIAWKSIKDDSEDLNLDAAQNRETDNNLRRANETVDARVKEAYCWLLVPYIDKNSDMKTIVWDTIRISGGNDSIITKAAKKMLQNEAIITQWAPALLRMELDNILWRETDSIAIKKLWEYLCTYCYLPRLATENVLNDAIQAGVNSTEYFAIASGFDGTRYIDLKFNQFVGMVERSGHIVKVDIAKKQFAEEDAKRQAEAQVNGLPPISAGASDENRPYTLPTNNDDGSQSVNENPTSPPTASKNKRFFMSADLDTTRINRDVQKFVEEIIQHLTSVDGARVRVSLEVEAESADGFTQQTVRVISENCRTMRVRDSGFEE